jgi:hypothetical protein
VSTDLGERLEAGIGEEPPHRPVEDRLAAGRRALRRRHRLVAVGVVAAAAVALGLLLLRPADGPGGGIDPPLPTPSRTDSPTPVHLLVAPPRYVHAGTPPVLYLYGRMFKRDHDVTVLATYGEIDTSTRHPQGAAIVTVGGRTSWVAVAGDEPERLDAQREAPYDYQLFVSWAQLTLPLLSGHLALAATAPGPYRPPVSEDDSPAAYSGNRLSARPGGTVVQRVRHPLANAQAVPPCHAQAVRVHTGAGDWFVLGFDCHSVGGLYAEPVGVRARSLSSWLARVKRAQDDFLG